MFLFFFFLSWGMCWRGVGPDLTVSRPILWYFLVLLKWGPLSCVTKQSDQCALMYGWLWQSWCAAYIGLRFSVAQLLSSCCYYCCVMMLISPRKSSMSSCGPFTHSRIRRITARLACFSLFYWSFLAVSLPFCLLFFDKFYMQLCICPTCICLISLFDPACLYLHNGQLIQVQWWLCAGTKG